MTRRMIVLPCVLGMLATASAPRAMTGQLEGQRAEVRQLLLVDRWMRAVLEHESGRVDPAVDTVNALDADDRKRLNSGLEVFLKALTKKTLTTMDVEAKRIAELGGDAARSPGTNQFLARAAMLHADAAMVAPYSLAPAPPEGRGPGVPPGGLVAANDGEFHGVIVPNWGWAFGRRLLDLIQPGPAGDPYVASWYHATTAYMMQRGYLGEVAPHLERAMQILATDARIVFDRACFAEALSLPRAREVLDDPRTRQALESKTQSMVQMVRGRTDMVSGSNALQSRVQAEAEAERLFRRVLSLDPTMAEAQIRLGRLYERQGRHGDALQELTAGIAGSTDEVALFYGHLFAGRAAGALRRPEEAAAHL